MEGTPNPFASVPPRLELPFGDSPRAPKAMKKGTSLPSRLTVSSAGTLAARLGRHRNSPMKQIRAQTVDAAILGSQRVPTPPSRCSLTRTGRSRRWKRSGCLAEERRSRKRARGARMRLRTSDWEASVKARVHRPRPKARSPRELCPSAALGRVVPEEPLFGRVAAGGREARGVPKPS